MSFFLASYHQKYRLQAHKKLATELGLSPKASQLLQTSYVAAKLNGYLGGASNAKNFEKEEDLGLTEKQSQYVLKFIKENGGGLSC
jgi:peptide-methionine (S)-S-oxide reductase